PNVLVRSRSAGEGGRGGGEKRGVPITPILPPLPCIPPGGGGIPHGRPCILHGGSCTFPAFPAHKHRSLPPLRRRIGRGAGNASACGVGSRTPSRFRRR